MDGMDAAAWIGAASIAGALIGAFGTTWAQNRAAQRQRRRDVRLDAYATYISMIGESAGAAARSAARLSGVSLNGKQDPALVHALARLRLVASDKVADAASEFGATAIRYFDRAKPVGEEGMALEHIEMLEKEQARDLELIQAELKTAMGALLRAMRDDVR
ncbi:hypothetical protein [Euzebya sp.]|uniref:hypothetical protein n=1 Tax=Euzebya sp. TaxID=1971409 RepID=UPI0035192CF5